MKCKLILIASILGLTFVFPPDAMSQWVQTNIPANATILCITDSGSFTWDARGLLPGMYCCTIRSDGKVHRMPILKIR